MIIILRLSSTGFVHPFVSPSVRLSVCYVRLLTLKQKIHGKTKIGVNVLQGRGNRSANFQFKKSKVKVTGRGVARGGSEMT